MTYLSTTINAFAIALATILVDHALDNGVGAFSRKLFIENTAKDIWMDAGAYLAQEPSASKLVPVAAMARNFFNAENVPDGSTLLKAMLDCQREYRARAEQEALTLPVVLYSAEDFSGD